MLTHTGTEPGAWQRFVNALIERCQEIIEELGREEMLLERKEFDQRLQRDAGKTQDTSSVESQRT